MSDAQDMEELKKLIMNERKFIHDISNKILIVDGLATILHNHFKGQENFTEQLSGRFTKILDSMRIMATMVTERRQSLHALSKKYSVSEVKDEPEPDLQSEIP